MALDCQEDTNVRFQSERNCGISDEAKVGAISARTISQMMSEPSTDPRRNAAMDGDARPGSFSKTSSRTEVSTAVTIAHQPQIIVRASPGG